MVDRDAKFLGDRGSKHVGTVVVGRVDAILLARPGDGDQEVARDAHQRRTVAVLFLTEHHDRVAATALHRTGVTDTAEVGCIRVRTLS